MTHPVSPYLTKVNLVHVFLFGFFGIFFGLFRGFLGSIDRLGQFQKAVLGKILFKKVGTYFTV